MHCSLVGTYSKLFELNTDITVVGVSEGLLIKPCVSESIKTCPEIGHFSRGKLRYRQEYNRKILSNTLDQNYVDMKLYHFQFK